VTWAVTATVNASTDDAQQAPIVQTDQEPQVGWCNLYDPERGTTTRSAIYWRDNLKPGYVVEGPAIIAEQETSTVVTSSFTASVNDIGHIILNRRG